jgi:hypothetical protein
MIGACLQMRSWSSFAKVLKVESDMLYFLAGRFPADLTAENIDTPQELAAAWKAFRREVKRRKKP